MYAAHTAPLTFADSFTTSRPRAIPLLIAVAIQVGFALLLASGLGVIHVASPPERMKLIDVPLPKQPPKTSEIPRSDTIGPILDPVIAPIEPMIDIRDEPIVVALPRFDPEPIGQGVTQEIPIVGARLLRKFDPPYPPQSRRLEEQGVVMLLLTVSPEGRVAQAQVQTSSGYPRLDQAAIESVRNWLFTPARRGPQPIAYTVSVPIRFELHGK